MASQGPQYPVNAYDDATVGTLTWSNFNNIKSDNSSDATVTFSSSSWTTTHYLKATNHAFSIPSNATINGIYLEIDKGAATGVSCRDGEVKLVKGDTIQSTNKASGLTPWSTFGPLLVMGYGGANDLWDNTWTYEDINASGFGAVLSASGSAFIGGAGSVDFMRLTVYYTAGGTPYNSGCDLYLCNATPVNSGTDLYTLGSIPSNSGCDLYLDAYRQNSGLPLYTFGVGISNSGTTLFLDSYRQNSGLSLYEYGHIPLYSGCNLYIFNSVPINSGLSLYEYGYASESSGLTFYMHGSGADPWNAGLVLYTKGLTLPSKSGGTPLYTYATPAGVGGLYSTIPLSLYSASDPRYQLNLFVKGPIGVEQQRMNLFISNDTNIANNLELFIKNEYSESNSGIALYLNAPSGDDGFIPISVNMPLFIARDSESVAGVIPLYMSSPEGSLSGIDMYIKGETTLGSGINLVIANVIGRTTDGKVLYTHGF